MLKYIFYICITHLNTIRGILVAISEDILVFAESIRSHKD